MTDVGPLRNPNILLCPSDKDPAVINTTDKAGQPISFRSSYGYNFEMLLVGTHINHIASEKVALLFDGEPDQAATGLWLGYVDVSGADAGGVETAGVEPGGAGGGGGGALVCPGDTNNMTWVCHVPPGNPAQAHCAYVGVTASGPQGHSNHGGDVCGPCAGSTCDMARFNTQLIDRRHFGNINVIYVDGHGEWRPDLSEGSIYP